MKTAVLSLLLATALISPPNDLRSERNQPFFSSGFAAYETDSVPPYDPGPFGQYGVGPRSPTAEIRTPRRYLSFSAGEVSYLKGSHEMENFYSPGWSYSVDIGFRINPYIVILPVAVSLRDFNLNGENFKSNFWANKDYFEQQRWQDRIESGLGYPSAVDYQATSSYKDFSYTPGAFVISPGYAGIRGFARIGAGIYTGKLSVSHQIKYHNRSDNSRFQTIRANNDSLTKFTLLYGAGLEYTVFEKFGLLFEMRYNVIYSGKDNSNLGGDIPVSHLYENPLLFYHLTPEGLKIHRFMEQKNLTTLDLRYGMTFHF